ncbi:hypothetical protein FB451DRAFT_1373235, partial [Mycena latifolia]
YISSILSFTTVAVPLARSSRSATIVEISREDHGISVLRARQGADVFEDLNLAEGEPDREGDGWSSTANEDPIERIASGGGCVIA